LGKCKKPDFKHNLSMLNLIIPVPKPNFEFSTFYFAETKWRPNYHLDIFFEEAFITQDLEIPDSSTFVAKIQRMTRESMKSHFSEMRPGEAIMPLAD